jgi:2-polyprenyl-3-methyl-5-hydroxy-6-metoxy-1,4-benzoquinol methylase
METNTPQLWDNLWKHNPSAADDIYALVKEENSIRWQRIEKIVLGEFGTLSNLNVIEIGAGRGVHAALMAKRDARVTVLDYSVSALKRAELLFQHNGVSANFIQHDALSLSPELHDKFDISMSFGLTEHFKGTSRVAITKAHFDVLKKGGLTFISVPNKYNLPYWIWRLVTQRRKKMDSWGRISIFPPRVT